MLGKIGAIAFLIGFGGAAGAVELNDNLITPLVIATIGAILIFVDLKKGEISENNRNSNDASYPNFLARIRRGA